MSVLTEGSTISRSALAAALLDGLFEHPARYLHCGNHANQRNFLAQHARKREKLTFQMLQDCVLFPRDRTEKICYAKDTRLSPHSHQRRCI